MTDSARPFPGWRAAMTRALYGPEGFFVAGAGPAAHFRTSVHASPIFGAALLRLLEQVDTALGRPDPFDVVDVGAGRGELLTTLARLAGETPSPLAAGPPRRPAETFPGARNPLAERLRLTAVELAPRPADLPATIAWQPDLPVGITGLLVATEWLDNVPLDAAEATSHGWCRVRVDPVTGTEQVSGPVDGTDADWLRDWWPEPAAGVRAEIGHPRDAAWAVAVRGLDRGLALAVDYGHLRADRPAFGTLTGYRSGRQVPPVPDGSCDLTAHVAVDSVATAGSQQAGRPYALLTQREALRALGVDGGRPPLALASTDPAGYVRALAGASAAAELTDPTGLGGHWWLLQPVGIDLPALVAP